jgi:hypothetical protein
MVAIALPQPVRQLSFLDAPAISRFDVIRLRWHIQRLRYTDALVANSFRLERQRFEQISPVENDDAKDGTLITGSYVEYILFIAGRLSGAVEVRSDDGALVVNLHERLARYLLAAGWQVDATRLCEGCAIASPGMRLDRVKRLLKGDEHGS